MNYVRIILLAAMLGVGPLVEAAPKNPTYNEVVNAFIESRINTDYKTMKGILSQQAVEKLPRAQMAFSFSAEDVLKMMKATDGVQLPCSGSSRVLAENDGMVMVQVDFVFPEHVISEFLTLEQENRNWKITQINKFFQKEPQTKQIASN